MQVRKLDEVAHNDMLFKQDTPAKRGRSFFLQ